MGRQREKTVIPRPDRGIQKDDTLSFTLWTPASAGVTASGCLPFRSFHWLHLFAGMTKLAFRVVGLFGSPNAKGPS